MLLPQVGFEDNGKLNGIQVTYYCDCGYSVNDCTVGDIMLRGDNGKPCKLCTVDPL